MCVYIYVCVCVRVGVYVEVRRCVCDYIIIFMNVVLTMYDQIQETL